MMADVRVLGMCGNLYRGHREPLPRLDLVRASTKPQYPEFSKGTQLLVPAIAGACPCAPGSSLACRHRISVDLSSTCNVGL